MVQALRQQFANKYLSGNGIEVGALHQPLAVPAGAKVKYVDRMTVAELRAHYPELNELPLVEPDILDNGEDLKTVVEASQDFLIANHMLEHCENPLGAMRNHFRVLKNCGVAYYAIPNKHFTFDKDRDLTPFHHLVYDDRLGPQGSKEQHFREVVSITEKREGDSAIERIRALMEMDYSIHYHVWDDKSFYEFLLRANQYLGNLFTILEYRKNKEEIVAILRKTPDAALAGKLENLRAQPSFSLFRKLLKRT